MAVNEQVEINDHSYNSKVRLFQNFGLILTYQLVLRPTTYFKIKQEKEKFTQINDVQ